MNHCVYNVIYRCTVCMWYNQGDAVGADKLGDQRVFSDVVQRLDSPASLLQRRHH